MRTPIARRALSRVPGLLLAAAGLAGCPDNPPPPTTPDCPAGQVRDADGRCAVPTATCAAEVPGSILQDCTGQHRHCFEDAHGALCGVCLDGFVDEAGSCRAVRTCADLGCDQQGRAYLEAGASSDARCGDCLAGDEATSGLCVPRSCARDVPGSIAAECAVASRLCIEPAGEEARCGDCYPGFVERLGTCHVVRSCQDLGCAAASRLCVPAQTHADASCGACRAGFIELSGTCLPVPGASCEPAPAANTILEACQAEHRRCVTAEGTAACSDCAEGHALDPASERCTPIAACSTLDCTTLHRACEPDPTAHCAGCLPGHVQDTSSSACRPALTCADLDCPATEGCVEATAETDAHCHPACAATEIWGGTQCTPCPPCDAVGEADRWPLATATGSCICTTEAGSYYSTAGDVGTFPCDDDGDGWVRESARLAIESLDPALRANARCPLRSIDRVELISESGSSREVLLEQPLALYETDRNDDQALLEVHWRSRGLLAYRSDGQLPRARELNRLTKLCHDRRTDYNDNGMADVAEWSGHALGPAMRADQQPFNEFSYFVELHRAHYAPPNTGQVHGRYVVVEKSRQADPAGQPPRNLAIAYSAADGSSWRDCRVERDPRWGTLAPPVGLDFARYTDPALTFAGMNHHSQFKCLVVDDEPADDAPQEQTPAAVASAGYRLNRCRGTVDSLETDGVAEPAIACAAVAIDAVRPGDVLWAAVPYVDYGPTPYHLDEPGEEPGPGRYQGGCVNACARDLMSCPGYDVNPIAVACDRDPQDFGRFVACMAWEVCDGLDNDGDSVPDNGDPGGGRPCDTGETGVCALGTTLCQDGQIVCPRDEDPSTELCNGVNDDCDVEDRIDESFPGQGTACEVPGLFGQCRTGALTCSNGQSFCQQTVLPDANETCDGIDHDCDGNANTKGAGPGVPGSIEGFLGCVNYYKDQDSDDYPDSSNRVPRCLCAANGDYRYREPAGGAAAIVWDCCDSDLDVHPGVTTYWTSATACGTYDYDCDGQSTKRLTIIAGNCEYLAGYGCELEAPRQAGWSTLVPECGAEGTYVYNCFWDTPNARCVKSTGTVRQDCR